MANYHNSRSLGRAALLLAALGPAITLAQTVHSKVILEENFRTPAPPNDLFVQNADHVLISTTVMFLIAVAFIGIASRDCVRYQSTVPLAMILGAAFCVVPEAIDNYLAGCYWSQSHDPNKLMFFLMGREFDYYVAVMWWAFGAILGYLLYAVLLREVKTSTLWICLGLSGVADIILEEILLGYGGIYTYFGHQPMVLIQNFPWWWLFSNVSSLFLSVSLAYRYRDWFNGWKSVFILVLMPFCYIGAFTLSAMPTIFAIQGNFSPFASELAGILTSCISIIQAGGMMHLVLGRVPWESGGFPQPAKLANVFANGSSKGNAKDIADANAKKYLNGHASPVIRKA